MYSLLHRSILFLLMLAWQIAVCADDSAPASALLTLDIESDGGFLTVPITINNKTVKFVLDTGSSVTVIDSSLMRDTKTKPIYREAVLPSGISGIAFLPRPNLRVHDILIVPK